MRLVQGVEEAMMLSKVLPLPLDASSCLQLRLFLLPENSLGECPSAERRAIYLRLYRDKPLIYTEVLLLLVLLAASCKKAERGTWVCLRYSL